MAKRTRQRQILDLVDRETIQTQDDLRHRLQQLGIDVNQATLSRDLRELRLVKTSEGYALPGDDNAAGTELPPLVRLIREFVTEVREAQNLLVLKTSTGSAQPVAAAIDSEDWPENVGTIGGDDTILLIAPNEQKCKQLAQRIREMMES